MSGIHEYVAHAMNVSGIRCKLRQGAAQQARSIVAGFDMAFCQVTIGSWRAWHDLRPEKVLFLPVTIFGCKKRQGQNHTRRKLALKGGLTCTVGAAPDYT